MTSLEIQSMRLRLPGVSPQQAEEIARQVSSQLADRLEGLSFGRRLGGLELKLRAQPDQTPEQLSEAIVQAILVQLER
jgi:hypothetical protein